MANIKKVHLSKAPGFPFVWMQIEFCPNDAGSDAALFYGVLTPSASKRNAISNFSGTYILQNRPNTRQTTRLRKRQKNLHWLLLSRPRCAGPTEFWQKRHWASSASHDLIPPNTKRKFKIMAQSYHCEFERKELNGDYL